MMKFKQTLKIREIAGENVVIIQSKNEADLTKVVAFNSTSKWLWDQLFGKDFTKEDVCKLLIEEFGISRQKADADSEEWIHSIEKAKLLDDEA